MWNLLRLEPDNIPNTLVAESVNTLVPSEDIQVCLLLLAYGGVKSDGGHHGEL